MAGYSSKKLYEKLGIKTGFSVLFIDEPKTFLKEISQVIPEINIKNTGSKNLDYIHIFAKEKKVLEKNFKTSINDIKENGMIWISWPKKSSNIITDLSENIIREVGLKFGVVDVKVCAVDENWSGLKFVKRLKDRIKKERSTYRSPL